MKKYWIIIVSCLLGFCLYHLNGLTSLIIWVIQGIYPGFNGINFWDTFMITLTNVFILTAFLLIKRLFKELARYKIVWVRRYKVSRVIINWAVIPYISFKLIYNPISYYGLSLDTIYKKIFIIIEVCLILYAIYKSIGTDNELYMKE